MPKKQSTRSDNRGKSEASDGQRDWREVRFAKALHRGQLYEASVAAMRDRARTYGVPERDVEAAADAALVLGDTVLEAYAQGRASPGIPLADLQAASSLVYLAARAMAGWDDALAEVRRIAFFRLGVRGPDSDVLVVRWIAGAVEAALWKRKNHPTLAKTAVPELRESLVSRFGEKRTPSIEDLAAWLARHSKRRARGRLTTEGIVTEIIRHGKLIAGLRDRQRALDYVVKALKRSRK